MTHLFFLDSGFTDSVQQDFFWSRRLQFRDIDPLDHFTFEKMTGPDSLSIQQSDSALELSWIPRNSDVGLHPIRLIIWDDSLASDTLAGSVEVLNRNDPPQPAEIVVPQDESEYQSLFLTAQFLPAVDIDANDSLFYQLTVGWMDGDSIRNSPWVYLTGDTLSYSFNSAFYEDLWYTIQIAVRDRSGDSALYPLTRFFINSGNNIPTFQIIEPLDSAIVQMSRPIFHIGNIVDSDDSLFTVDYEIYKKTGELLVGRTYFSSQQYVCDCTLVDNAQYAWRSRVHDASGGSAHWSPMTPFFVNFIEENPGIPLSFSIYGLNVNTHYLGVDNPTFYWGLAEPPDPDPLEQQANMRFMIQIFSDTTGPPFFQFTTSPGQSYYFYSGNSLQEHIWYYATLYVIDQTGRYSERYPYVAFYIDLINDKPVFESVPEPLAWEDIGYRYLIKVFDAENDPVFLELSQAPQEMTLLMDSLTYNGDTLLVPLRWLPTQDDIGLHTVQITLWDHMDRITQQTYQLEVKNTNDAPQWLLPLSDTTFFIRYGQQLEILLNAYDEDSGDSVRFIPLAKPTWCQLSSIAREGKFFSASLTAIPDSLAIGNHTLFFRIADDSSVMLDRFFNIQVTPSNRPPGVPIPLSPASQTKIRDTRRPTLVALATTDPDDSLLTYNFEVALDNQFHSIVTSAHSILPIKDTVRWTIGMDLIENTYYYWRIRARDAQLEFGDYSSSQEFFINLVDDPPNKAPELLQPANHLIFHQNDSLIFRFTNPTDPDTPPDSLRFFLYIYFQKNGNVFYYQQNQIFDWSSYYTTINLTQVFLLNGTRVENESFYWRVLVQDNTTNQLSSQVDTFRVSFLDEVPNPINQFQVRKDNGGFFFSDTRLETNNDYVYFQWSAGSDPDPEDSVSTLQYRVTIFEAMDELAPVDTLLTFPNVFSAYSHQDSTLITDGFVMKDNIRYRASISALDQKGLAGEPVYSFPFLYNSENDAPSQPVILNVRNKDDDNILRDTNVTIEFMTMGDMDYTDSIETLGFECEISSDTFFNQVLYRFEDISYSNLEVIESPYQFYLFGYTLPQALENYKIYFFRLRIFDDGGLFSQWSNAYRLEIQSGNRLPQKPVILSPTNQQEINETNLPPCIIQAATDPDGDSVRYYYQLYELDPSYALIDSFIHTFYIAWTPGSFLSENGYYRYRVRSFDGKAFSGFDSVSFYIDQLVEPPTVPQLFRVKDLQNGIITNNNPSYLWKASADPDPHDEDNILYHIEVNHYPDTMFLWRSYQNLVGNSFITPEEDSLTEDAWYRATIRAEINGKNEVSQWVEPIVFKVNKIQQMPQVSFSGSFVEVGRVYKGVVDIEWEASDLDDDPLVITIEYSGDYGNSWMTLPALDVRGDSMYKNDSLYYWNCNDTYTIPGELNSQLRLSVTDGLSLPVAAYSQRFTIARISGAQPKVFSPDHEPTRINFNLSKDGAVTISVYNLARRLVRQVINGDYFSEGDHYVEWDGRDQNGNYLPNRLYFIVVQKPGNESETSTVVIMRK